MPNASETIDGLWICHEGSAAVPPGYETVRDACVSRRPRLVSLLTTAVAIAETLQSLHRQDLIHRHLTSDTVLVDLENQRALLVDTGLATRFSTKLGPRSSAAIPEDLLPYISPEQTGRMNRVVDYRSDLYSLGGVLYEMLSGTLPFARSLDPMELVHSHIARRPRPLSLVDASIPVVLSDIVGKLLAKNAEDRYQSAHGLAVDLQRCLELLRDTGRIAAFALATDDSPGRLAIPQRLYGREPQIGRLIGAFGRVREGARELVLVTGSSGTGKSTLVNEVHKPITECGGHFIWGKYEQYARDVPYAALAQAFDGFCTYLLTETEARFEATRLAILDAIGSNGRVLTDLFVRLHLIIGEQPLLVDVGPQETQNRFNMVMQQFMRAVSSAEHPLVLFLDDLQWADQASLNLLRLVLTDEECHHLLVVGASRDNEVSESHPLALALSELRRSDAVFQDIAVRDLAPDDVNKLVSEALSAEPLDTEDLSAAIVNCTQGNAYFTIETLKWLGEEHLIEFDHEGQRWHYDVSRIEDRNLTEDVVELMQAKLDRLPESAGAALTLAAQIGHVFDLGILSAVQRKSQAETLDILWPAVGEGFVAPLDESYRSVDESSDLPDAPKFKFKHDRVLQAAFTRTTGLDGTDRDGVQLEIGQLLLDRVGTDPIEEQIFDIVSHLAQGERAMVADSQRIELAELSVVAGKKAKKATAYTTAIDHFQRAVRIFEESGWGRHHTALLDTHLELAESCYLIGQYDRAEAVYLLLLDRVQSVHEEIEVRTVQTDQYQLQGRFAEALLVQQTALAQLGLSMPRDETQAQRAWQAEVSAINEIIGDREIGSLLQGPKLERADVTVMLRFLDSVVVSAYCIASKTQLTLWACAKMARLSLEFGLSELAASSFVNYALMAHHALDHRLGSDFAALGVALCERYDDLGRRSSVYQVYNQQCAHWTLPYTACVDAARRAWEYGLASGNFARASYGMQMVSYYRLASGRDLDEVHAEALELMRIIARIAPFSLSWSQPCVQHIACLRGLTESPVSLDNDDFDEGEHRAIYGAFPLVMSWVFAPKLQLYYLFDEDDRALALVDQVDEMADARMAQPVVPELHFFASLVMARCHQRASNDEKHRYLDKIAVYQSRMKSASTSCEANYRHKYLLVEAECLRLRSRLDRARQHYADGIESARQHGFTNHQALGAELFARFHLDLGERDAASARMCEALELYRRWGAVTKVDHLERQYADLLGAAN